MALMSRSTKAARRPRAVIASRLFSPEPAAASFRLAALAKALDARGYAVRVLTTTVPENRPADVPESVDVRRWPVLRDKVGYVRGYLQYLSYDVPLLGRLLLGPRPDVVVCEPPPTTGVVVRLACALRRVPYLYYAADLLSEAVEEVGSPAIIRWLVRLLETWALHGAATVVTVNETYISRLRSMGVAADRIAVVGNGTDTTYFRLEGAPSPMADRYLVYAGTASEVHGASIIVHAMPKVLAEWPDARLVVIGQGSERPAMEREGSRLPAGAVVFFPRLDPETTARWLRGARAAIATVRPGTYSFTVATKMFAGADCGTPVLYIGAEGPGADMVREAELGDVVQYEVDAVARAMVTMLRAEITDDDRRRRAAWVQDNVSLDSCAARIVAEVDAVVPGATGGVTADGAR